MATAGEAASLFGAADSANDPFALPPPEEPQPTGNDPFANVQPTTEAADLFGYPAPQEPTQTSQQGYTPSHVAAEGTSANWNGSSVPQAASSSSQDPYAYAPQDTYAPQAATNGWNEPHGQWSGYNAQQQYGSANGAYTNGSYAQAAPVHDPYASQTNYAYAPSKAASQSTTQPSTYAPYAPSANGYNAYTPATTSHATSYEQSYDPYKPSQGAPAQHVGQSSSTYAQFVNGSAEPVSQVEAPARSAAAAAQYRPKTFNAYDPPIPPPKAAPKRPAAWQSPVTSPAQVAYSSLPGSPPVRSAQSPALPPPPRKASVPPPPPRTGSAARQYAGSPVPPPLPHPHAPYGVHQPPPSTATPPPPRTGSAARHFATPQLPSTQYSSPPASSYTPSPPSHQSAPPPPAYQSPPPPSTYQSPSPPSTYQPPAPSSAYASHQPPPQETVSPATVTPPITQGPYGPGNVEEHSHPASELPAEASDAYAAESPWDEIPTQAVEEAGSPPTEHIPSDGVFDPEAGEADREAVDHTAGQEEAVSLTSVPETHEHHPGFAGLEAVADEEYDPEGGQLDVDGGYTVDAHANASEAYVPQTSPPQPASIASAAPAESVYDPYRPAPAPAPAVPPYGNASNNPYSPPAPSAYSPRQSADADRPTAVSSPPSAAPATRSSVGSYAPSPYAYEPASTAAIPRTTSPSSFSVRSSKSTHSVHDLYAPPIPSTISTGARYRSMSNGSMLSTTSVPEDPYAPAPHSRQQSTDSYSYSVSHATPSLEDDSSLVTPTTSSHAQVVTLTAPTRSQYAPSPSLLGSNDPLGRTSVRVPVFTFGFGGKIVTCFHGSEMLQTGFDVAMSSKASTSLRLRQLSSIIPQSAMETSTATYPGPLFSDPGTPTTTLVRPGAAAHAKAKKAKVVKYLEERAEEITQGLGYLHQGSVELYRAEAKRALINLVKVMVENDGKLSGTPQIDVAVRAVLVPGTEPASESSEPGTAGVRSAFELTSSSYGSLSSLGYDSKGVKLADHPLWSAQLDKIETLLVRGDRRGAFHYAADEKLWAHAMVIASSIDKEAWKEVVTEFVRSELSGAGAVNGNTATPGKPPSADRREPLRVAYSLFAGQGSGSVQELHPPKALGTATQSLSAIPATFSASTPLSAGFQQPVQPVELSKDVLMKWPTTAAMMIGSPLTVESSSALTALGDHLAFNGWHEAAHVCYLLSPQTSLAGGVGTPGGRVVLYGSPSPAKAPTVCKDPDAVIFSEIVEYALSLATPSKGQEPFHGLAYLQPYRLLRATYLAELGHIVLAKRYCEAISSSINRPSPYLNITFLEQLKDLTDRLIAAPMMDKSGSWIGSKMAKPSLDKIGNWLEGRFTSFIAGEGDSPNPAHNSSKVPTFSGPFAHFSSISSATNSTMPSPHMSSTNLADMQAQAQPAAPPFRTGSAMALRTSTTSPAQIARASSAIDYLRRKPSPVPRVSSAGVSPVSTLSAQSPYGYPNGYAPSSRPDMSTPTVQEDAGERSAGPQIASWWGAGESESATPTATTFAHPDEAQQPSSSEGFISLIDTPGFSGPSSTTQAQFTAAAQAQSIGQDAFDDEEDLGFGNNSSRKKASPEAPTEHGKTDKAPAPEAEKPKEAEKPAASGGGWLSRLWKRSDSSGPVKANLGEENTFYYDPEQKRWVNKNAPPEAAKPTPPPPPPARAQTASPGMASARGPPPPSPMHPPPARPATAIDLTDGPSRKPPMRIRSNLAPPDGSSAPTTPGSAPPPPRTPNTMMDGPPGLDAPPTPGARRAPAKRNARNRYVDVFQQQ